MAKKPSKGRAMAKNRVLGHHVNCEWCKGCGICVHFCPKNVLELDESEVAVAVRPGDCIGCQLCERRCPDLAIEVELEEEQEAA